MFVSKFRRASLGALFSIVLAASAALAGDRRPSSDVIIEWNALLQQFQAGQPFTQIRGYALLHVAMSDAVVSIDGTYNPFQFHVRAHSGASAEAAAAQAGHDVFYALVTTPEGRAAADAALMARVGKIPAGPRLKGMDVGGTIAAKWLAARQNDGYAIANPQPATLLPSTLPGIWRPTPSGAYQFSNMGVVTPFGLLTPGQFLPAPFPQIDGPDYAEDLNEVKRVGRAAGGPVAPERTEAQGRFAQLFAASPGTIYFNMTNPLRLWSNVTGDMARQHGLSLAGTARLFALTMVSMNDSLVTSQYSKEVYRLWRPETAIANADVDNNPLTEAEAGWRPHIITPPYPAYASNMTCLGAGGSRMLANVLGSDAQTFTAKWTLADGTVVWAEPYTSLWQLGDDEANSRIWGGIHFRFDIDESQVSCVQVADYLFDHYMRRTKR